MEIRTPLLMLVYCLAAGRMGVCDPPAESAIVAEWRARQEGIRSAQFSWKYTEQSYRLPDRASERRLFKLAPGTVLQKNGGFAFAGAKYSFRCDTSLDLEKAVPLHSRFDGRVMSDLLAGTSTPWGKGTLYARDEFAEFANVQLWPIVLTYRPLGTGFGIDPAALVFEPNKLELEEYTCSIANVVNDRYQYTLYVDEAFDSAIRRIERRLIDVPKRDPLGEDFTQRFLVRVDLDYERTADQVIYPSKWRIYLDPDSDPVYVAKVDRVQLNVAVEANEFSADRFPDGTLVADEKSGWLCWQRGSEQEQIRELPPK